MVELLPHTMKCPVPFLVLNYMYCSHNDSYSGSYALYIHVHVLDLVSVIASTKETFILCNVETGWQS